MKSILISFIIIAIFSFQSCVTNNSFQHQVNIPDAEWNLNEPVTFEYNILDTNITYQTHLIMRHDDAYPYSNIWLRFYIQSPIDSQFTDSFQTELIIADNQGYWLGEEQGSFFIHRIPLNFKKLTSYPLSGNYKIKIAHLMRKDPLPSIINIGWQVTPID